MREPKRPRQEPARVSLNALATSLPERPLAKLTAPVQGKLDHLLIKLGRRDVDEKCIEFITKADPDIVVTALDYIEKQNINDIKNLSGLITSCVSKTKTAVQVPRAKPLLAVQVQALLDEMCAVGILQREEIDQDTINRLAELGRDGRAVLEEFLQSDLDSVSNSVRFLNGMLQRSQTSQQAVSVTPAVPARPRKAAKSAVELPAQVRGKLDRLIMDGLLQAEELDGQILQTLADLPPQTAVGVLQDLGSADVGVIRNKAAWLQSAINTVKRMGGQSEGNQTAAPIRSARAGVGKPVTLTTGKPSQRTPSSVGRSSGGGSAKQKLEELFRSGAVQRNELSRELLRQLNTFADPVASVILDKFAENVAQISNKEAFLTGLVHSHAAKPEPERPPVRERPTAGGKGKGKGKGNGKGKGKGKGAGKPEVYVRNLPADYDEDQLRAVFGQYGDVVNVKLTRAGAFVEFDAAEQCEGAIASLNDIITLDGAAKPLQVSMARGS
jgi:hypothetical protein